MSPDLDAYAFRDPGFRSNRDDPWVVTPNSPRIPVPRKAWNDVGHSWPRFGRPDSVITGCHIHNKIDHGASPRCSSAVCEDGAVTKREIVRLVDDLDGGAADQTVSFGLEGRAYMIDLSDEHAEHLRSALREYVAAARSPSATRERPVGARGATKGSSNREQARRIRDWARAQGLAVPDRGRIPKAVLDAYHGAAAEGHAEPSQAGPGESGSASGPSATDEGGASTGGSEDEKVLRWHQAKGYKVPADGSVSGLMRHRYRKAAPG